MNFLAHAYLSGGDEKVLVGNFIGDFVKGKLALQHFDPGIVTGIQLHRAIDHYTDTHPVVTTSKQRLRQKYRHYASVIVDVFYDHFLASNWSRFHGESLAVFAEKTYTSIEAHWEILPEGVKYMLPYMRTGNWLYNYASLAGINRALTGMANRTAHVSHMESATADLQANYAAFKEEFDTFFPLLNDHCKSFLEERQPRE